MKTELNNTVIDEVPDFRVGDTVYSMTSDNGCIEFKITNIVNDDKYQIKTVSENGIVHDFTLDGKHDINHGIPCLSHTPYDFVNGGFSQRMKRVLPDIPVDTVVYVRRDRDKAMWLPMFFAEWKDGIMSCWDNQMKSNETNKTQEWKIWSLTNPLESK